ncbi:MAG: mechanosensitive ion channel family protein [Nitrospiraceae bacterium]|uniref:mechanosensitive ion channel family protein n=1 Tax=Nitrospira cf. moscoviensis SBR1015 TaxID=96242 RepID=UPI000A0CAD81|nr:mechanosensitive ion channel family protein [Nitrospira cf. moscoviensis SBR1015]MBX9658132.1 mechanosensitive ion channel family protein [Nitrospiraceae bacterium]OQW29978.1 MAG: mechanosensitive ion channel protein [Nitrospira sp. SG-bin2]
MMAHSPSRNLWLLMAVIVFGLAAPCFNGQTSYAQTASHSLSQSPPPQPSGAPVIFADDTLFVLYDKIGPFTPQERARAIAERLAQLAKDPFTRIYPVTVVDQGATSDLVYDDLVVMTVTDRDAQPTGKTRQEMAAECVQKIQAALSKSRQQSTFHTLVVDGGLALLDTVVLVALLIIFHKTFPKIYSKIDGWRGTAIHPIKIQRVELLSADQIAAALTGIAKTVRIGAVLILLYIYLTTVLGIFPWTRGISMTLLEAVLTTLRAIGEAFAFYIPNIVSIAIIIVVARYILKVISLVFVGIGKGAIRFAGFHPEWAEPTYKIVRFLVIVFTTIAIFPYIPGSQSEGFRGISVFLGLLISLGSAAAIGNIIAGVVLTYMRPFRVGDRVKITETTGDVVEKTLLVTRVRTIKNVDVTIPNAMVLASHLINFSACARNQGLILHTSVTIGYDTPWRKVHELLIAAARGTTYILPTPEPFVLQTSLNDFYVTYELNAYTDQPNLMATIYAELHQHIQDTFNEAGVEIMSPHYTQLRDGNKTAIPDQYLPKAYRPSGIRISPLDQWTTQPGNDNATRGEAKP